MPLQSCCGGIAAAIGVALWASKIAGFLLGDAYQTSGSALSFLALGMAVSIVNQPLANLLMFGADDRLVGYSMLGAVFVQLSLVTLLGPVMGATGAGVAFLAAQVQILAALLVLLIRAKGEKVVSMTNMSMSDMRDIQLDLLRSFKAFCEETGLVFYLCAGSLLGAVRDEGFIPWDDDIDVMMWRSDFERLLNCWPAGEQNELFRLGLREGYPYPFAKLSDARTWLLEYGSCDRGLGVNIDIFPIDYWPDGRISATVKRVLLKGLAGGVVQRGVRGGDSSTGGRWVVVLKSIGLRRVGKAIEWVASRTTHGRRAGVIVWGYAESVATEGYGSPTFLKFENESMPAPSDSDEVLRSIYGDADGIAQPGTPCHTPCDPSGVALVA